jgi:hypothetical protein
MGLIYGAIAAAVFLLGAIWFFFFARKKPAERRTPSPSVVPVIPKPISPYGKAKTTEPVKDENLIQYGSVGQLNKKAEEPAPAKPVPSPAKPKEDPPTHKDPPVAPVVAAPIVASALTAAPTPHSDISTHDEAEPDFAPVSLTEPVSSIAVPEPPRASLPEPVERPLPVVRLNLGALEETPSAPRASEPGPDLESLPRIQLVDAPLTSPPAPADVPDVVGSDLPAISFDASVPLDLGPGQSGHEELELPDDIMPGIKLAEETLHLGGADDVSLNDLPDVAGSLESKGNGAPTIRLVDTPLEALAPSKVEGAAKPHADVPTIKLVE